MHIGKRVFLYLTRKKGKNFILCIVFFLISFSLLSGSSVLQGISQISKDLRSTIGASFDVRPYEHSQQKTDKFSVKELRRSMKLLSKRY